MYRRIVKRIIDILVSLVILIISSPILIITILLLFIANSGTPFFIQKRPGINGVIFKIIKFKTMNEAKDKNGNLLPDAERITKIGRLVRKTSIDELPQLINVFNGDMSLIGPRPLLPEYLPLYNEFQRRRHEVRPGITGWAQVNGRNTISWQKKFEYDVWYVDNISLKLDLKILLLTILKVLKAKDINSDSDMTAEKFNGIN